MPATPTSFASLPLPPATPENLQRLGVALERGVAAGAEQAGGGGQGQGAGGEGERARQ